MAGFILERQSGKSLDELSRPLVFDQLLGEPARWRLNDLPRAQLAAQYEVLGCVPGGLCFDPQSPSPWQARLGRFLPTRFDSARLRPYAPFGKPQYPDGGVRTSITGLGNLIVNLLANARSDDPRL